MYHMVAGLRLDKCAVFYVSRSPVCLLSRSGAEIYTCVRNAFLGVDIYARHFYIRKYPAVGIAVVP